MTPPVDTDPFLDALVATLSADPHVLGLVLAGSSARPERRDRWSDHDFLVVTVDGVQEQYRTDLTWLPEADDIAWSFRETAHGLKVLYRSGLLLEFAVFDRAEFSTCALDDYRVVIDRAAPDRHGEVTIAEVAAAVSERSIGAEDVDPVAAFRHFLALVYVGTGRARRGERLSANVVLRDYATAALLRVVRAVHPALDPRLDRLDPWRRVHLVWPEFAAALDEALSRPVDAVGPALLDVAAGHLPEMWPQWPSADAAHLRSLLA